MIIEVDGFNVDVGIVPVWRGLLLRYPLNALLYSKVYSTCSIWFCNTAAG